MPSLSNPTTAKFLTAEWRKLIMAQYAVDPAILAPWLPPGVELDLFHGQCFVSVIGFLFDRVRIKGIPFPWHTRFEEVNLRFYAKKLEANGEVRRGVVFIRELVPRLAITLIANLVYEEPYATVRMRRSLSHTAESLEVRYDWRYHDVWYSIRAHAAPVAKPILEGSIEDFITEHYWGFTRRSKGATSQYQVEHPRWQTYAVRRFELQLDFAAQYGPAFAMLNDQQPASVLLAEGSAISVYGGTRLSG